VKKLAGGAYGAHNAARRVAAFEDVGGFGQPYRAQESRVALMDVRQRHHGTLHPFGSLVAKHDRVDAADTQAASPGGALSGEARADHRVVRSGGARMEPGSDAV
jgi:hypothetical protein